ncbi:MAG: Ig-like domain-containing protein, partial [Sulfurovaceae bacterium]
MAKVIQLITKGTTEQISSVEVGAGKAANTLIIKAQAGVKYELKDTATKFAPHKLLLTRKGKDLWIKLDDEEGDALNTTDAPDIIIENYYSDSGGSLIGLSEDGQYCNYVSQEGNSDLFSINMDDGEFSYQSLACSDEIGETIWTPFVLGALLLGGLALALHDDDDNPPNTPDAPDMTDATDTGVSNIDDYTGDNTPDFAIIPPAEGETPNLYIDGMLVSSTFDPVNNILTPINPILNGPHTITITVTDSNGESSQSPGLDIVIDTTPPATTVNIDSITDDSGTVGDFITNDNDGLIVGATLSTSLASGEKLLYSTNGGVTWTDITASVFGTSVSYHDLNLSTTKTVLMKVIDGADNDGAVDAQLVTIDDAGPTTTININSITDDSGVLDDFITNDNDGLIVGATLSAELAAGEKLMYRTDGGIWIDITSSVTGTAINYTDANLTATDVVQMKVVDEAENDGAVAAQLVTIDTTPPITAVNINSIITDSGIIGDFETNDDNGLVIGATLSSSLALDEKLLYSNDNGATWIDITASVSGMAVSYYDIVLVSTATVKMKVVDPAGNEGATDTQLITIDVLGPATTVNIDGITVDSGTVGDFITSDHDGLTVDATLSAELASGEKLLYRTNGGLWVDITSFVSGTSVSYTDFALTNTANVQMKVVDATDNDGAVASQLVTIDIIYPTTTVDINSIIDDSGVADDFITSDNDGLIIDAALSAQLAADEKLMYSTDGGVTWIDISSSVVGANVSYFDATLTSTKTVEMRVVDAADNHGPLSAQLVTIDATAPTTTVIINGITDDTGTYGNFVTNDNNGLLIDGILSDPLASDERLMYSTDGGATWLDITSSVIWINVSYFDASLTSTTTVQMKVVDAADNNGAVASQLITIDTTPPTITVNIDSITDDSGTVGDFTTIDNNGLTVGATLSATLASDDKLLYSTDGGATWLDITSSVLGTSVSYHDLLLTSTATVEMKVVDEAGNNGAVDAQLVTITVAGPATTIDINSITDDSGIAGDFTTNDNNGLIVCATLSAGLDVGEKLLYSTNSGVTWIDISSSVVGVNVSYTDATLTSTSIVDMKVVDAADNDGAVASKLVTIDTTAPTTTVIANHITDDSGTVGDFITNDNDGLSGEATLSTSLAPDEKLLFSNDNGATWIDITSSVNVTTVNYYDATLTSTTTVKIKVVDAADNDGAITSQLITIDTTPPATTININSITDDSGTVGDFITNDNNGLIVGATLSAGLAVGEKLLYSTDGGASWTDITASVFGTSVSYHDLNLSTTKTVEMKVVDAADNDGAVAAQLITIDDAGPTTTININSITDDSGILGDFITNDNNGLSVGATLSSELAAGEKLMYRTNGGIWIDITSSVVGTAINYTDASLTATDVVQMKVVDVADNDGAVAAQLITIDTTPPITAVDIDSIITDSGIIGDFETNDNNGLVIGATLSSSLALDEKLLYSNDNGATWIDITASISGMAVSYYDIALVGTATVKMKVVDPAGNEGATDTQLITIDVLGPATTINIDSITDDSGTVGDFITSNNDGLTVDATLSATLASGEKLLYRTNGGLWIDISSFVSGTSVSYTDFALTNTANVQMKVVDSADNDGAVASQLVTIDISTPTTTVDINSIIDDSGVVDDFITNDNNGLIVDAALSAELATDEKLMYSTDGGASWTDITSSVVGANVSYFDATLTSTKTVEMRVVDAADNHGPLSAQLVTIDA